MKYYVEIQYLDRIVTIYELFCRDKLIIIKLAKKQMNWFLLVVFWVRHWKGASEEQMIVIFMCVSLF